MRRKIEFNDSGGGFAAKCTPANTETSVTQSCWITECDLRVQMSQVFKVGLQPCCAGIWLNFFWHCTAKTGKFSKCLTTVIAYIGSGGHVLAFHAAPKHCFTTASVLTVCLPSGIKFELRADESWWDTNAKKPFAPPGLKVLTGCWQQPWPTSIAESRY